MEKTKYLTFITSIMLLAGISSVQAASFEGVIKGAQCHIQGSQCVKAKNDPLLVLENDFVLVSGSDYYFLPNLPREEKLKLLNDPVRIEGSLSGREIDVDKVIRNQKNNEQVVWDWEEINAELYDS